MRTRIDHKGRGRLWALMAVLTLTLTLTLTACSRGSGTSDASNVSAPNNTNSPETASPAPTELAAAQEAEDLVIPLGDISETATYYPLTVDGTRMEVVAVKAPDGTIRTAFNTCQVCNGSPKAYFEQKGGALQCQNCGNLFSMERVGIEAGGCNPVPIFEEERTVTDESVTVAYATLQANAYRFPSNWKQ